VSEEFLTSAQLKALTAVIAKARADPGIHRESTPDGEAFAYQYIGEIYWGVNGDDKNLAPGRVPLKRQRERYRSQCLMP
jgi:hypothetical protein